MSSGEWVLAVWVGALVSSVVMLLTGHVATASEWIAGVKDVATTMGLVAAAYVGIRGLSTWERQLKGNAEFERARALARATYALRDQVRYMRAPMLAASEFPKSYLEQRDPSREERADAQAFVYNNRWATVREALLSFDLASIEAEAIWGPEIRLRSEKLRMLLHRLITAVEQHLDGARSYAPATPELLAFRREMQEVIAGTGGDGDMFWAKLQRAIDDIDEVLKPHLRWYSSTTRR